MFSVCPHLWGGGGGVPRPGPAGGGGIAARSSRGVLMLGSTWGTPQPGQDKGVSQLGGTPSGAPSLPRTGQHMEYLICHGWYASSVHAGGLSCFLKFFGGQ